MVPLHASRSALARIKVLVPSPGRPPQIQTGKPPGIGCPPGNFLGHSQPAFPPGRPLKTSADGLDSRPLSAAASVICQALDGLSPCAAGRPANSAIPYHKEIQKFLKSKLKNADIGDGTYGQEQGSGSIGFPLLLGNRLNNDNDHGNHDRWRPQTGIRRQIPHV